MENDEEIKEIFEKELKKPNFLDNSRPLDVHRWSDYPEVKQLTDDLLEDILALNPDKRSQKDKLKKHLRMLLIDLYHNHLTNPEGYIGYSRSNNAFKEDERYNKLFIKKDSLLRVIDGLIALGYIEHHDGIHYDGFRRQSRMKATPALIDRIYRHDILPAHVERVKDQECIIAKSPSGKVVSYPETQTVIKLRKALNEYNDLLHNTLIDCHLSLDHVLLPQRYDLSNKLVRRVFNESFNFGGRFYGGWWQSVNKEVRRFITINGKPTVEVDYKGLHIDMLYYMAGYDPKAPDSPYYFDDPYAIDGYPKTKEFRNLFKQLLLILINAKDVHKGKQALRKEIRENPDRYPSPDTYDLDELISAFERQHHPIKDYFFSDAGILLQNIDSAIAAHVIKTMTRYKIPTLCIHDSFICEFGYINELKDAMQKAFKDVMGKYYPMHIITRQDIIKLEIKIGFGAAGFSLPSKHMWEAEHDSIIEENPIPWVISTPDYDRRLKGFKEVGSRNYVEYLGKYTIYQHNPPKSLITVEEMLERTEKVTKLLWADEIPF